MSVYYSIMREVQSNHWVEEMPRPRSRKSALRSAQMIANVAGNKTRVVRCVNERKDVKTFTPERLDQ